MMRGDPVERGIFHRNSEGEHMPILSNVIDAGEQCRVPRQGAAARKKRAGQKEGARMEVVDHMPQSWFLLTHDKEFYLDVLCALSSVSFSLLIKLTQKEMSDYRKNGVPAVRRIAENVQRAPTGYYGRNQPVQLQRMLVPAIFEHAKKIASAN